MVLACERICTHTDRIRTISNIVCKECGIVLDETIFDERNLFIKDENKNGKLFQDYQFLRIEKLNRIYNNANSRNRQIYSRFQIYLRNLQLEYLKDDCIKLYVDFKSAIGRKVAKDIRTVISAIIYICARQRNVNISINDIVKNSEINRKAFNKALFTIMKTLHIQFKIDIRQKIMWVINKLELPIDYYERSIKVYYRFKHILTNVNDNVALVCVCIAYFSINPPSMRCSFNSFHHRCGKSIAGNSYYFKRIYDELNEDYTRMRYCGLRRASKDGRIL